jgi:hypothetical protein
MSRQDYDLDNTTKKEILQGWRDMLIQHNEDRIMDKKMAGEHFSCLVLSTRTSRNYKKLHETIRRNKA